jgi:GT2 family glycosyltransferase
MRNSTMQKTSVHLVTVLYKSQDALPGFLDCLAAQTLQNWQLTVVDNASPDGSHDVVAARMDPRVTLLRNKKNLGFGRAANQGLRAAADQDGEFFVVINNDVRFSPTFLADFNAARTAYRADVIVPRIMFSDDSSQSWYAGGRFDRDWLFSNVHDPFNPEDAHAHRLVEFASGCCLGLDRSVLETVGLFDESFFVYWEDADLSLRLNTAGVPIHYVRDPHLLHEGSASSGGEGSPAYERLYYRSYTTLLRRHFGSAYALRSIARFMLKEFEKKRNPIRAARVLRAMLAGMLVPLQTIPRLPPRATLHIENCSASTC